ncbi:hyaluronan-binding protein 2-like [Chelmon rostratus]|uniref:hyaluronan-binding protein 2-like n=1 Tax=Chelmon rostratus TaxID=109905 RepID=UPI001BEC388F|nr:hyaluronan-binding protein 2-like [Chelmon rostratus]
MLAAAALLISLSVLSVHGQDPVLDDMYYVDYTYDVATDYPDTVVDPNDWLFELLDETNVCDPNPCYNGGSCQSTPDTEFTCSCPEPYVGNRCQRVKNLCENIRCGRGDCVINLQKPPYFECKCRPPFHGPNCNTLPPSPCEPNPCQNGGSCSKGNSRLRCACPDGFTGRFCEIAPGDCYSGNGKTYRGAVSETENGTPCLDWNSNFILLNGDDPFIEYSDFDGLDNNHCRNPDGDERPWCYVKKERKLKWEFCNIKKCPDAEGSPQPPVVTPAPGTEQFSQCGIPQFHETKVWGGGKSRPGAYPWQASLQARSKIFGGSFRHICGGTLISSCWVLTAAHCIDAFKEYQVVLGGVDIDRAETTDQTIPVIETIVHENYRTSPVAVYNDVALLKLKVTDSPYCAEETRYVKTACLPDQDFPAGTQCVISGWGATENKTYSRQLLNAHVLLISEARCQAPDVYAGVLDSSMLCAGILKGGVDSCQGDSGGPLVCEKNGKGYVTGVVSWGDGCGKKNKPGIYANVHKFVDWIKSKMA